MAQAILPGSPQPPAPRKMTFEGFLEWCDEDTNAEWVDGEVVWMSPVSHDHGWIMTESGLAMAESSAAINDSSA